VLTPPSLVSIPVNHSDFPPFDLGEYLQTGVPQDGLQYLRRLEVNFVTVFYQENVTSTIPGKILEKSLERVHNYLKFGEMTITINLIANGPVPPWIKSGGARDLDGQTAFRRHKLDQFMDLIKVPFATVEKLYVRMVWSYKFIESDREFKTWWAAGEMAYIRKAELEAERYVKGDGYQYDDEERENYKESAWVFELRKGTLYTGRMPGPRRKRVKGVIKFTK